MKRLEKALEELWLRQTRRSHPKGEFNSRGWWYPSPEEERPCCREVPKGPYTLLKHCRTLKHIANLFNVPELYDIPAEELRQRWKLYEALTELEK